MISLTEQAAQEINKIIKENNDKKMYIRIGVKGGGCSGFAYTMDMTEILSDQDEIFNQYDVDIICDPKSLLYVDGTIIDFKDELVGRGFIFNNPNTTSKCGCGSSFSV